MFDRYVIDKRKRRPLLYLAFLISTIFEGALIIFFIIYSLIHVEEVQPPPLTVSFIASAPPPPPPPAPKKKTTPKPVVKPVTQPTAVPSAIVQPKKEEEAPKEEDTGSDDGVEGGVEGGMPGGVVGGAGSAPPPPPPPPPPKVVNKPAALMKNERTGGENPHLPEVIKAQRRGQTVTGGYKVCIDQSGRVNSVSPIQPIPGADAEIMNTLRNWSFKPQPLPVCFIEFFNFVVE